MNRFASVATLAGALLVADTALAQSAPSAPQFKSVLSGKKFEPPVKGQVEVEYLTPKTEKKGDKVITSVKVKSLASGPIARLKISETWFDKTGGIVNGGEGVLVAPLLPSEIQTITIETPFNAKMSSPSWNFTHANGTVKLRKVKAFDEKEPAPVAKTSAKK